MQRKSKAFKLIVSLLLVVFTTVHAVLAAPSADNLDVGDGTRGPDTNILIPVGITNVQDGPIAGIGFDISYDTHVILVVDLQAGNLTSSWDISTAYKNYPWGTRVSLIYGKAGTEIADGSTGSVARLNFRVIGDPGETTYLTLDNIQLSDPLGNPGTAPADNGRFKIIVDTTLINTTTSLSENLSGDERNESSDPTNRTKPKPSCFDGVQNQGEINVDCGGPCGGCPWIKVDTMCYINENLTIVVINPRDNLSLIIEDPSGRTILHDVTSLGSEPYKVIQYTSNVAGRYYLQIPGYDSVYVTVKRKSLIPYLEEIPEEIREEVRSLFIPFIIITLFVLWWRRRRSNVVVDEYAIQRFMTKHMLQQLIKKYRRVYIAVEMEEKIKNLVFIEITEPELIRAENLSDRYGIPLEDAKSLVLSEKLRAKKFITGVEFPHRIGNNFKGTEIVYVEDELGVMES